LANLCINSSFDDAATKRVVRRYFQAAPATPMLTSSAPDSTCGADGLGADTPKVSALVTVGLPMPTTTTIHHYPPPPTSIHQTTTTHHQHHHHHHHYHQRQ
jgi:hypothetical protein